MSEKVVLNLLFYLIYPRPVLTESNGTIDSVLRKIKIKWRLDDIMTNEIKEIYEKAAEKRKKADFSTGFEDLDNFCKYLDGGDVLIIGGRPAMGKTNFAISLLNHLLSVDKNVLFFTPEQSKEQFVQRLLAKKWEFLYTILKMIKLTKMNLLIQ